MRIRAARLGYALLLQAERELITPSKWSNLAFGGNRLREDQEAMCQKPCLTAFIGGMHRFLQDLSAHSANLKRKQLAFELEEAREEAKEWIKLAQMSLVNHKENFEAYCSNWDVDLGFSESFLRTDHVLWPGAPDKP